VFADGGGGWAPGVRPGDADRFAERPIAAHDPVRSMSVTSFGDYIASPYLFYLRHVLKLRERDASARELDAAGFGALIHATLRGLEDDGLGAETDPARLEEALSDMLTAIVQRRFGGRPTAAVRAQVELARGRLAGVAAWQADRARDGWRILRTEWSPEEGSVWLEVDGDPMVLRGAIDRIDAHESGDRWAVLDYKTAEKPPSMPRNPGVDDWKDLQLPLYLKLVEPLGPPARVEVGYVSVPKRAESCGLTLAPWSAEDLATAYDRAAEVVRAVRAGLFDEVGEPPVREGVLAAMCGVGMLEVGGDDDEPEDGS